MKKFIRLIGIVTITALGVVSCGNKNNEQSIENTDTTDTIENIEVKPEPKYNPLTGLEVSQDEILNRRPISIMINNSKTAIPQNGIGEADIIYEALAEGNITRLMAVYYNPFDVEYIGSVRSARPYFVDLSQSLNSIYFHFGGSNIALEQIDDDDLDTIDGTREDNDGTVYIRDQWRIDNMGKEHSAMTSGDRLLDAIDEYGYDTEIEDGYYPMFNFVHDRDSIGGEPASSVSVNYSKSYYSDFEYAEQNKTYLKSQFGEPHIDANDNEQLDFTNLMFLDVDYENFDAGGGYMMRKIDLIGEGNGYYMSCGESVPIIWKHDSQYGNFDYYDINGNEIEVNPGKTYIGLVDGLDKVQYSDAVEIAE